MDRLDPGTGKLPTNRFPRGLENGRAFFHLGQVAGYGPSSAIPDVSQFQIMIFRPIFRLVIILVEKTRFHPKRFCSSARKTVSKGTLSSLEENGSRTGKRRETAREFRSTIPTIEITRIRVIVTSTIIECPGSQPVTFPHCSHFGNKQLSQATTEIINPSRLRLREQMA